MSSKILGMYRKAGVSIDGKGIHTQKFHEVALAMMKKGMPKRIAYATAMKNLGRDRSVKAGHRR